MKSGCCTICLEPLIKDIQVSSVCGHVFHRSCIYRWIDSANTCPNCKQHCDASQLTNLFLDPLEIIKEVLNDPTVLENVDSDLLLKIYTKEQTKSSDEDDVDLQIHDIKHKKNQKQDKMELIQERIKNTALNKKNQELNGKLVQITSNLRKIEDEKSVLHKKIQSYLKTAQNYERKYFEIEEKVKKLNIDLFKKNKELNISKKEIDRIIRQHQLYEHRDNILIGNVSAVNDIEVKMDETNHKSNEEQKIYWKSMYDWILKEYRRSQSDRERDKKSHQTQQKKWSKIHEEQRLKIESLSKCGINNLEKINKYKKHYFSLKDKYLIQRQKLKGLHQNEEEIDSISYDENQENIKEDKQEEEEDQDDDLQIIDKNRESVFNYPSNNGNTFHQRGSTSCSLFGAYRQMKSIKDGHKTDRNPFSNNTNRKRNFTQFAKGDDGRGGKKTFLAQTTNNYKRRRVIKTSGNLNNNRNNRNKSKNITNFFRSKKSK